MGEAPRIAALDVRMDLLDERAIRATDLGGVRASCDAQDAMGIGNHDGGLAPTGLLQPVDEVVFGREKRVGYVSMIIVGVIVFCVLLLVLAFVFPKLSRHPERGGQSILSVGSRGASKAPGPLGRWFSKPFQKSSKAVGKSGSAGRSGRSKLPL